MEDVVVFGARELVFIGVARFLRRLGGRCVSDVPGYPIVVSLRVSLGGAADSAAAAWTSEGLFLEFGVVAVIATLFGFGFGVRSVEASVAETIVRRLMPDRQLGLVCLFLTKRGRSPRSGRRSETR